MNHKEQDIKHTDTYINHTATEKWEFALQKRLKQCAPSLHRNYLEASTGACMMLDRYRNVFPQYTDHSSLHCLNIMNLAGQLVGDCLLQLNGSELYVLLTGILFHDLGMGISKCRLPRYLTNPGQRRSEWDMAGSDGISRVSAVFRGKSLLTNKMRII